MSVLRKYPKLAPPPRKRIFTVERSLLAAVGVATLIGGAQMGLMNVASVESNTRVATQPAADYTPVGSIEVHHRSVFDPVDDARTVENKKLQGPYGLRPQH